MTIEVNEGMLSDQLFEIAILAHVILTEPWNQNLRIFPSGYEDVARCQDRWRDSTLDHAVHSIKQFVDNVHVVGKWNLPFSLFEPIEIFLGCECEGTAD